MKDSFASYECTRSLSRALAPHARTRIIRRDLRDNDHTPGRENSQDLASARDASVSLRSFSE